MIQAGVNIRNKTEKLYRNLGGNIYIQPHSHTHTHQFLFKLKTKINEYHNRRVSKIGVWIWNLERHLTTIIFQF